MTEYKKKTIKDDKALSSFIGENIHVLLILLLALTLRLVYFMGILRGDSVNYTSYAYLLSVDNLHLLTEAAKSYPGLNRPGLYAPAAIFIKIFGANEFAAVLFPLLASLVTCFFIYRIARLLASEEAGLLAAFLWAVFPLDIFMATQLDPEGPLTMATSGSIYYLALANFITKRKQKIFFYILSIIFVVWAFYIKQSSLPIIFVLLTLVLARYLPKIKSFYSRILNFRQSINKAILIVGIVALVVFVGFVLIQQPWPIVINSAELSAYDISPAFLLGRLNPIGLNDIGRGNYFGTKREPFTPPAPANMLTESTPKNRFVAFDAFVPIFIIAIAHATITRKKNYNLPLVWFGILFFYLEWGVYPRSFSSDKLFYYLPISHWISADNFLYLAVPMLLVISLFISERINPGQIRKLLVWALVTMLAAVFLFELPSTRELSLNYIALALILIMVLGFWGSANLSTLVTKAKLQNYVFSGLVLAMGIAALKPSVQYHVSGFYKEQERRENLLAASAFLADQPSYPIYAKVGPVNRLNLRAGFEYGYYTVLKGYKYPESRFTNNFSVIRKTGGYSISYGCGQPVTEFGRWPLVEFGDPESSYCVSLHRYLPRKDVDAAFDSAKQLALSENSAQALEQYIEASTKKRDLGSFVDAVSRMVTLYPENRSILQAYGIIKNYGLELELNPTVDLIEAFSTEENEQWEFGDLLEPSLLVQDEENVLQLEIEKSTQEVQPISLKLVLKSNTAYILDFELAAFAPYDLVRFPDLNIPDSYTDSWNRSLSWTKHQVVFVTPIFDEAQTEVILELARVYDRGDIQFRKINLIEVVPYEPLD